MFDTRLFTIAVGMTALLVGGGAAKADVMFGNAQPTVGGPCVAHAAGDEGAVCPNSTLVFKDTNPGGFITTSGFSGAPETSSARFLTLKANDTMIPGLPSNAPQESGLGTNLLKATIPAMHCTDAPDCEIAFSNSVTAVANSRLKITDAVIGSVQTGELFNFFVEPMSGGPFNELAGGPFSIGCTGNPTIKVGPFIQSCIWNSASATGVFGIAVEEQTGGAGADDILLTSVSTIPVSISMPEPASLSLLGVALLGLGMIRRRRRA